MQKKTETTFSRSSKGDSSSHVFKWIGGSTSFQREMVVMAKVNRFYLFSLSFSPHLVGEVTPCFWRALV